jgi:hypothetical protein
MYVCMHVCVCVCIIVSIVCAATFSAAALLISSASVTIGLYADTYAAVCGPYADTDAAACGHIYPLGRSAADERANSHTCMSAHVEV